MFMEERHREIAEVIRQNGKITIAQITEKYEISDESARRDLRILEQNGLCKRTHGGAIVLSQVCVFPPKNRNFKSMPVFDNYREIAKATCEQIKENDVVYLTGGSFGFIMLNFLPSVHFTVVINSVDLGAELRAFESIETYFVGGKMRQSGSVVDTLATEFVSRFHFDTCFITGAGLTADFGLSNGTDETAAFQRAVIGNSRNRVLLMPGSKIGVNSFIKVCDSQEFNRIITDWDCDEEQLKLFADKDIAVTAVSEPK